MPAASLRLTLIRSIPRSLRSRRTAALALSTAISSGLRLVPPFRVSTVTGAFIAARWAFLSSASASISSEIRGSFRLSAGLSRSTSLIRSALLLRAMLSPEQCSLCGLTSIHFGLDRLMAICPAAPFDFAKVIPRCGHIALKLDHVQGYADNLQPFPPLALCLLDRIHSFTARHVTVSTWSTCFAGLFPCSRSDRPSLVGFTECGLCLLMQPTEPPPEVRHYSGSEPVIYIGGLVHSLNRHRAGGQPQAPVSDC